MSLYLSTFLARLSSADISAPPPFLDASPETIFFLSSLFVSCIAGVHAVLQVRPLDPQRQSKACEQHKQQELRNRLSHKFRYEIHRIDVDGDDREDDPLQAVSAKPIGKHGRSVAVGSLGSVA